METRKVSLLVSSLFLVIYSASLVRSGSVPSQKLLGVAPEDEKYFSVEQIKCKDGSKKFTISQLNDDFCDCPDGTDEPGTSACPTGKFYCRNAGHVPHAIFSSKVNDGICDCCDGSDEYDGKIKCKNTCWEAGKVARDRLQKKITTFMEGAAIRKREVEQAKVAAEKDKAELTRLKNEEKILKGLVEQLKDRKEQIEKAEEKERIQREKEEKAKKEAEEAISRELEVENKADVTEEEPLSSSDDDKIGLLEDSPAAQYLEEDPAIAAVAVPHDDNAELDKSKDNEVKEFAEKKEESSDVGYGTDPDAGSKREDASEDTDSLSREELGRMVGSRWTGKKNEDHNAEDTAAKDNDHENDNEAPENVPDEEYNSSYESDTEDDHQYDDDVPEDQLEDVGEESYDDSSSSNKYESDDELDMSDVSSTGYSSWLQKIQKTVRNILQAVNLFQAPVDKSEAEHVRKEYDESSSKLTKIQSRISSLSQKLKHDFGPEKEFYSLYGQCFESKQNKYVYKICPFKEATQVEGYSTTRLGSWENFEESHRIMHFTNGEKCWNGPNRSMKVRLRCGLKNELADVDEPSRCEYVALLSTPLLCREEKLQELRDKLNLMNKEQPQDHDEL